jgi:hypothetical protein
MLLHLWLNLKLFAFELAGQERQPSWIPVQIRRLDFIWSFPQTPYLKAKSSWLCFFPGQLNHKQLYTIEGFGERFLVLWNFLADQHSGRNCQIHFLGRTRPRGQCRNVSALRSHLKRLKIRKRIRNVSEGSKTPASTWTDAVSDREIFRQPYKGGQKIFRRTGQEKGGMGFLTRSWDEKTLPKSLWWLEAWFAKAVARKYLFFFVSLFVPRRHTKCCFDHSCECILEALFLSLFCILRMVCARRHTQRRVDGRPLQWVFT